MIHTNLIIYNTNTNNDVILFLPGWEAAVPELRGDRRGDLQGLLQRRLPPRRGLRALTGHRNVFCPGHEVR